MPVTQEIILSGVWELLYTNNTPLDVTIIFTPVTTGVSWGVREDTTPLVESFNGHALSPALDEQRIVEPGESFFVRGAQATLLAYSIGD